MKISICCYFNFILSQVNTCVKILKYFNSRKSFIIGKIQEKVLTVIFRVQNFVVWIDVPSLASDYWHRFRYHCLSQFYLPVTRPLNYLYRHLHFVKNLTTESQIEGYRRLISRYKIKYLGFLYQLKFVVFSFRTSFSRVSCVYCCMFKKLRGQRNSQSTLEQRVKFVQN